MAEAFIHVLYNLWPNGDEVISGLRDAMAASVDAVCDKYQIDPARKTLFLAMLMGQMSEECGAGHEPRENLNYSASGLVKTWPTRFRNIAAAAPFAHNPQKIANEVYNGRMGNVAGTDDGWNFRGRGGSQTTGREGYSRVAKATGLDVVTNPDLVIDPKNWFECSVADMIACGCLPFMYAGDVVGTTKKLNGGLIGIKDRKLWVAKWRAALGAK